MVCVVEMLILSGGVGGENQLCLEGTGSAHCPPPFLMVLFKPSAASLPLESGDVFPLPFVPPQSERMSSVSSL